MDMTQMLYTVGFKMTAIAVLILLVARTLASALIYKMLGEWDTESFAEGIVKQVILYGTALVLFTLTGFSILLVSSTDTLNIILSFYYTTMGGIMIFTVGKLAILLQYAMSDTPFGEKKEEIKETEEEKK